MFLNHARKRAGAEFFVISALGDPVIGGITEGNGDIAVGKLGFKLQDKFLDHPAHNLFTQRGKSDDRIETVAEFGAEQPVDGLFIIPLASGAAKSDRRFGHLGGARIGGHDQNDISEINRFAVMVRELAVIHDLKQDIEQIRMRLFDLVKQQHAVRMLVHPVGEQAALIKADIARRRANQTRDGVTLHIFRHVKADKLNAENIGKLARNFRFTNPGRTREQIGPDRFFRLAKPGARELDRRADGLDGRLLTINNPFQVAVEIL